MTQGPLRLATVLLLVVTLLLGVTALAPEASAEGSMVVADAPAAERVDDSAEAMAIDEVPANEVVDTKKKAKKNKKAKKKAKAKKKKDQKKKAKKDNQDKKKAKKKTDGNNDEKNDGDTDELAIEIPNTGVLRHVVVHDLPSGIFKTGFGRDLDHLRAHLNPDTEYQYLEFDDGLHIDTGLDKLLPDALGGLPTTIVVAKGTDGVLVIDPDDYVYIGGACPDWSIPDSNEQRDYDVTTQALQVAGATTTPSGQDCGIGFSVGGNIDFTYDTPNLPNGAESFAGHVIVDAVVPVHKQLEVDGTAIFQIQPGTVKVGGEGVLQAGMSGVGSVALGHGAFGFRADARPASAGLEFWAAAGSNTDPVTLSTDGVDFVFPANGEDRRFSLFFEAAPDAAGVWRIGPRSNVHAEGTFSFGMGGLGTLAGTGLGDLNVARAKLHLDRTGIAFSGMVSKGMHPTVGVKGTAELDGFVSFENFSDSWVEAKGTFDVGGVGIGADARMYIGKGGFEISGELVTPISRVAVSGFIDDAGVQLTGSAEAKLGLSAIADAAHAGIADARREIAKLDGEIVAMRKQVKVERRSTDRAFRNASAALRTAQADVRKIQKTIDYNRGLIRALHVEYRTCAFFRCMGILAEIAALEIVVNGEIVAKDAAVEVLKAAEWLVERIRRGLDALPTDLDPRIIALITAREAATLALDLATEAAKVIDLGGNVHVALYFSVGTKGLDASASAKHCDGDGNNCKDLVAASVKVAGDYFEVCVKPFGFDLCAKL